MHNHDHESVPPGGSPSHPPDPDRSITPGLGPTPNIAESGARPVPAADPLLQPTVADARSGPPPWRTSSMFYVGFFGGPLAVAVLATLNARRLGASQRTVALVAGSAGLLFVAWIVYAVAFYEPGQPSLRLAVAASGVVAHLVQARLLGPATRGFELGRREPAPLWVPGLVAVVGSTIVSSSLLVALNTPQL